MHANPCHSRQEESEPSLTSINSRGDDKVGDKLKNKDQGLKTCLLQEVHLAILLFGMRLEGGELEEQS